MITAATLITAFITTAINMMITLIVLIAMISSIMKDPLVT